MEFIGLRKDKETEEILKYPLNVYRLDVSCIYLDRYGVYICTNQGKMYKVDHTVEYLREELQI